MEQQAGKMEGLGLVNPNFWQGRRVFLTGHTGFKGSWLSLWLSNMGAEVIGYALQPPTEPNLFERADIAAQLTKSIIGDVRNAAQLQQAITITQPELVIHMAAQPLVRASYNDPVGTYATNVMGTVNLLESVRQCSSVRAVLIVTSDKCYENREQIWGYRECDAMGGYDPYSNSKGCAELITAAYRQSFFNPKDYSQHRVALASARAGNVIGGGDWAADRLIPDAIRAFSTGKPLEVRNPTAIRPWQHVLEPLSGYLQLCQQLLGTDPVAYAEGWNFGPHADSECQAQVLLNIIKNLWDDHAEWANISESNQPHEAHYLRLDCTKARSVLSWQPVYDLRQTLDLTVEWYKASLTDENLCQFTNSQIKNFMIRTQILQEQTKHAETNSLANAA